MNRRSFFAALAAAVVVPHILAVPSVPTYTFKMTSTPIVAKPMKLKAVWTEECDANLHAMYDIRAEQSLLEALTSRS